MDFMAWQTRRGVESAENPDDECHRLKQSQKLADLYDYLPKSSLSGQLSRTEQQNQTYTSQVAESHMNQ